MKTERHGYTKCTCCGHIQDVTKEWANPQSVRDMEDGIVAKAATESELQTATHEDQPLEDAATFFEQLPEPVTQTPSCNMPHKENEAPVFSSELQTATQESEAPPPPKIIRPDRYRRHAIERQAVTS